MKVADLAPEELKSLIEEAVGEKLKDFFFDPDRGLELREEAEKRLGISLSSRERIPLEEVKKSLNLTYVSN